MTHCEHGLTFIEVKVDLDGAVQRLYKTVVMLMSY